MCADGYKPTARKKKKMKHRREERLRALPQNRGEEIRSGPVECQALTKTPS